MEVPIDCFGVSAAVPKRCILWDDETWQELDQATALLPAAAIERFLGSSVSRS